MQKLSNHMTVDKIVLFVENTDYYRKKDIPKP